MEKIALDASVCIALFKDAQFAQSFTQGFHDQKPYLPTVAAFELLLRSHSIGTVESLLNRAELLNLDEAAARKAAEIFKELKSGGNIIGSNDIFIAATAIVNGCALATLNVKDFSRIKGLKLVKLG